MSGDVEAVKDVAQNDPEIKVAIPAPLEAEMVLPSSNDSHSIIRENRDRQNQQRQKTQSPCSVAAPSLSSRHRERDCGETPDAATVQGSLVRCSNGIFNSSRTPRYRLEESVDGYIKRPVNAASSLSLSAASKPPLRLTVSLPSNRLNFYASPYASSAASLSTTTATTAAFMPQLPDVAAGPLQRVAAPFAPSASLMSGQRREPRLAVSRRGSSPRERGGPETWDDDATAAHLCQAMERLSGRSVDAGLFGDGGSGAWGVAAVGVQRCTIEDGVSANGDRDGDPSVKALLPIHGGIGFQGGGGSYCAIDGVPHRRITHRDNSGMTSSGPFAALQSAALNGSCDRSLPSVEVDQKSTPLFVPQHRIKESHLQLCTSQLLAVLLLRDELLICRADEGRYSSPTDTTEGYSSERPHLSGSIAPRQSRQTVTNGDKGNASSKAEESYPSLRATLYAIYRSIVALELLCISVENIRSSCSSSGGTAGKRNSDVIADAVDAALVSRLHEQWRLLRQHWVSALSHWSSWLIAQDYCTWWLRCPLLNDPATVLLLGHGVQHQCSPFDGGALCYSGPAASGGCPTAAVSTTLKEAASVWEIGQEICIRTVFIELRTILRWQVSQLIVAPSPMAETEADIHYCDGREDQGVECGRGHGRRCRVSGSNEDWADYSSYRSVTRPGFASSLMSQCLQLLRVLRCAYVDPPPMLQRMLTGQVFLVEGRGQRSTSDSNGDDSGKAIQSVSGRSSHVSSPTTGTTNFPQATERSLTEARQLHSQLLYETCRLGNGIPLSSVDFSTTTAASTTGLRSVSTSAEPTMLLPEAGAFANELLPPLQLLPLHVFSLTSVLMPAIAAYLTGVTLPMRTDLMQYSSRLLQLRGSLVDRGLLTPWEYSIAVKSLQTLGQSST